MEIVDPLADPSWDVAVAAHPRATIFHRFAWAAVLRQTYGHHLCYARFADHTPSTALVPLAEVRSWLTGRRGVSLPFTDACDALSVADGAPVFAALCQLGLRRGWKHLELRGSAIVPASATPSVQFLQHDLDLTQGPEKLIAAYAPSVRRALRKGEGSGLTIEISSSAEAIRAYFQLHVQTRQRHGAPPQPWAFFKNLHRFVLGKGLGFVVLAKHGAQPVAGAVFLHSGQNATYKFGAADLRFQHARPSNLVMAAGIRHLAMHGFTHLDFGRTSLANQGLRRFKRSWGARETSTSYFRYDLRHQRWSTAIDRAAGASNALFRRLPTTLNRMIGAFLYRHLD